MIDFFLFFFLIAFLIITWIYFDWVDFISVNWIELFSLNWVEFFFYKRMNYANNGIQCHWLIVWFGLWIAFLDGLRNESREVAVSQLLHYLPLLRPANSDGVGNYVHLLPRCVINPFHLSDPFSYWFIHLGSISFDV